MAEEKEKIEGVVEHIIYYNQDNDYAIFRINSEKYPHLFPDDEIVCVGNVPNIKEGENVILFGDVVNNSTYGKQFKIGSYKKTPPRTKIGIERYLASGNIKGIGKKLAEKIVKNFGINTIDIIENSPEKLATIKGISIKRAIAISEEFKKEEEARNILLYLEGYSIPTSLGEKIYKTYKEKTITIVENNPYRLADDISRVGFKLADDVAQKVGIEKSSKDRIKCAIRYILRQAGNNKGHVYLPESLLINETINLIEVSREEIEKGLYELHMEKQIRIEKSEEDNRVFIADYYYAEAYVAKKILSLSKNKAKIFTNKQIDENITIIEKEDNKRFAPKQKMAIKKAMEEGVLVITGGPGTGKTTTITSIINMFLMKNKKLELCAPTGRAAKRMTEATNMPAQTLHRLLGINYMSESKKFQTFEKNQENPIEADVIIVDECSMIDIELMKNFLKAVGKDTKVILVGDVGQLPSVGAGNVLKDIINSGLIEVVKLDEIFRQARESAIIMNAHRINKGEYPLLNEKDTDFFFLKEFDISKVGETVIELITKRLPKFLGIEDVKEIQVLSPMKKGLVGVEYLNNILQEAINPPNPYKNEKQFRNTIFREGDKVMQIKNNYNIAWDIIENYKIKDKGLGVFNGEEGVVDEINEDASYMKVVFDDNKYVKYSFTQLEELSLSYAITIHKSQGSEYKAIILPIHSGAPMLLNRNLLYTAITRAKELAVIVGIPKTLFNMVDNNNEINRYSYLEERIRKLSEYV